MKIDIKKWFYSMTLNKEDTWVLAHVKTLLTSDFTLDFTHYNKEQGCFYHEYPIIGDVFHIYTDRVEHHTMKEFEGESVLCFDRVLEFSKKVKYLLKEDFQYAKEYLENKK